MLLDYNYFIMKDGFGRTIDYLRLSITDRCNLRCRYCMPDGIVSLPMSEILSIEETIFTTRILAELGIKKIKITGGEPLVRKGCIQLIRMLKEIPGIEEVTLTTNGVLLSENLPALLDAGISAVNISLDTLDRDKYRMITGFDCLNEVLTSVDAALNSSIPVKINTVSVDWSAYEKNTNKPAGQANPYDEIVKLVEFAEDKEICVRFIEMMPLGLGKDFPGIPHSSLIPYLADRYEGMTLDNEHHGNGPAVYYKIPGFTGNIGFISAVNGKFCESCNRIRLTTTGYLKTCLCYDKGVSLMDVIRSNATEEEKHDTIKKLMKDAIDAKPEMHCFEDTEKISEKHVMSSIGG